MTVPDAHSGKAERQEICWTSHPLAQEPWPKSALLATIILALSVGAAFSFEGSAYGLVTLCVLGGALARYWLPTRYRLDRDGVHVAHLGRQQRRFWREFRRLGLYRNGVLLSPFARPCRMDSFRGCFLRCPGNREVVIDFARRHVAMGPS
jgi:hypothetical protein